MIALSNLICHLFILLFYHIIYFCLHSSNLFVFASGFFFSLFFCVLAYLERSILALFVQSLTLYNIHYYLINSHDTNQNNY